MQTQTTASPATTGKRGIPLSQQLFAKAIDKALTIKPPVVHIGAHYGVMMADQKSWAHVSFCVWDGRIYATCNCKAHTLGDYGKPIPCYHIAAAALMRGAANFIAASEHRATAPRITAHTHACPYCCDVYPCNCKNPETDDLVCDGCGSRSVDWADAYGNDDKTAWM